MAGTRTRRGMTALVRQWEAGGETREAFARRHGLTVSQLDYWKRQVRQAEPSDAAVRFTAVRVRDDQPTPARDRVEVVLRTGERIVVRDGASIDLLRTVLAALRASC
jgi:transposase-like protein